MAIRITRVYTRTGDSGQTALVGGKRVPKHALRVEAYGALDELNAAMGVARAFNADLPSGRARKRLEEVLVRLQNELFDLGGELATPPEALVEGMFRVGSDEVRRLEALIDELQTELAPLESFILPGGGKVAALLHECRTACRRAERVICSLGEEEDIGAWPLKYVNRLGDLFFVLARWVAKRQGEPELLWERGLRPRGRSKKGK